MSAEAMRDLVPTEMVLPCEHTAATITVAIEIGPDGVVQAPYLAELASVLAHGSVNLVKDYCVMWTRWLARSGAAA